MKKNIKVIIGIIVGIVIGAASGIGVYATLTYSAGDIAYTKSGTNTQVSVSSALNELYQNKKETTNDTKSITTNGTVTLDKYYKNLNVNVPIPAGYIQPSGTKTINENGTNIDVKQYEKVNVNVPPSARQVGTFTQRNQAYTFQNSGYIIGTARGEDPSGGNVGSVAYLLLDNDPIVITSVQSDERSVSIYVPAGKTVRTRSDKGTYNLTLYEYEY